MLTNPHAGRNFIYVSGEIGIGSGVVINGEIIGGARGFSGEIGHVAVQPNGPQCRCGAYGCLEQYAGQEAIARAAGLVPGQRIPHVTGAPPPDIVAGARAGNRKVLGALDSAGTALGIVLAGMINVVDVDTVILGGIYTRLEPWLHNHISRELSRPRSGRRLGAGTDPRERSGRGSDRGGSGCIGRTDRLGSSGRLDSHTELTCGDLPRLHASPDISPGR